MYEAKVIEDSIAISGSVRSRLTTIQVVLPRFVLAELNTHRVFSRNSASSRAIPVEKQIAKLMENPFIPDAFASNKRGMQAGEDLNTLDNSKAQDTWLRARDYAVKHANELLNLGIHKQWANRLLEPFMWHTVVITSTHWDNFWALRISHMAQPEIAHAASLMFAAFERSTPTRRHVGEYHLPYVTAEERLAHPPSALVQFATARCARTSYLTQEGDVNTARDFELHDRLATSGHMSPFEHPARVVRARYYEASNFSKPWLQYRKQIPHEFCATRDESFEGVLEKYATP